MRKALADLFGTLKSPRWIEMLFWFSIASFGQTPQTLSPPATTPDIAVDGAVHPHLIADDVAYSHLFQILMINPASKDLRAEHTRRDSYSKYFFSTACGVSSRVLTPVQIGKLLAAVDKATPRYLAEHSRMTASRSQGEYDSITRASQFMATDTFRELESVDSDLASKVRLHTLEHVKSRIKIISARIPQE